MINLSLLSVFIPTFFMVSLTPGMCMTLSMVLGMTVGVKRALWMMFGELTGVALVALAAGAGVATLMLRQPMLFAIFKGLGGAYLAYLGVMMWRSRGRMAIPLESREQADVSRLHLLIQGFVTAIANPKGWALFIALLPPFLDPSMSLAPQLAALIGMILSIELLCLLLYAGGGRSASQLLAKGGNVRLLNRIAGTLMIGVGIWLAFG